MICYYLLLLCLPNVVLSSLLPKEIAEWAIKEFEAQEEKRKHVHFRGIDRRSSTPFISGDGFRTFCDHICEDHNRCRITPEDIKDGDSVFVKTDFMDFFATSVVSRINSSYILVTHNGDLSAPDGQSDAPAIRMSKYVASDILLEEYKKKKLIAHHGQNLWWKNKTVGDMSLPIYSHCLPIGFENRQWNIGKNVHIYCDALKQFVLNAPATVVEDSKKPLLLIAFYPKSRVPDRIKVLNILGVYNKRKPEDPPPWYNFTDLSHWDWLEGITRHHFVLAPFGHGLDTHRVSEILLMGGVPVMRRSTISSCYDDSDNTLHGKTRGSLPIVIVDRWEDVTKERLEKEWERIKLIPKEKWDWSRVFIYHWIERIFGKIPKQLLP
jgi:hypothetical protein